MLSTYHSLDHVTLQLLEEEWRRMPLARKASGKSTKKHEAVPKSSTRPPHELSPIVAALPHLIQVARDHPEKPIEDLRPMIKRVILEQLFVDITGDSIIETHHHLQVKQYVELTVRVLVRFRWDEFGAEQWSDMPITPQMFG